MRQRSISAMVLALRVAGVAGLTAAIAGLGAAPASAAGFKRERHPINTGYLFDLTVADYDSDGNQGLVGTNHKFLGTVTELEGGHWRDDTFRMGLNHSPDYPGFEDLLHRPLMDNPGLYLFADSRRRADQSGSRGNELDASLNVVGRDLDALPLLGGRARLTISLVSPHVRVLRSDGARVRMWPDEQATPPRTVIQIELEANARVRLRVRRLALPPIGVDIAEAPLLRNTYVGPRAIRASSNRFELRLQDRHGIAWGDVNADGTPDAYITVGGVGGGIARRSKGLVADELLLSGRSWRLENSTTGSGLVKQTCRGRAAALVDFDADGDLDVFSSCEGSGPRLWRQNEDGGFRGILAGLRHPRMKGSAYRWADLHPRRGLELIVAGKKHLSVHRRGKSGWRQLQRVRTFNRGRRVDTIAIGDFDRDGDVDIFLAAPSGNTLLVNRRGRFRPVKPQRVGLPRRSLFATWVDYDNDGRLDLHALPDGLYRATKRRAFRSTGKLRMGRTGWAVAAWWDYDGDGRRDVAMVGRPGKKRYIPGSLHRNTGARRNWLQVDVGGPGGSAASLGARVEVVTARGSQVGWVGQSDSSRYSAGNYRLFFGLGKQARVKRVKVRWPDGARSSSGPFGANRRVTIPARG